MTDTMPLRILLAVTHLLGVGHLSRMAAIGRGLAAAGHAVTLVSGGRPAPTIPAGGMEIVQLPPVHCVGVDFRTLLAADGSPATPDLMEARRALLLETLERVSPDVVVTELFPFGRRQLAAEFMALVDAARARRPRPALLVSIRDILNPPSQPSRAQEALERLGLYDRVLAHGDAAVAPLSASWPVEPALERRLAYTGYVAEDPPAAPAGADAEGAGDILVSGGGSAASLPLFRAALDAARRLRADLRWRILVGHGVDEDSFAALREAAPANVVVERARRDFTSLLGKARLSVSQAGYNTMVDLLRAGVPSVVVPFEAGNEREQRWRAELFAARGLVAVVPEAELSGAALAGAVADRLASGRPPDDAAPALDGIARSAAIIAAEADAARRRALLWTRIDAALDALAARGRRLEMWWRDDDAVRPTPDLDRLLALAQCWRVPLALAVIPAWAEPALAARLAGAEGISVLQHGWSHENNAQPGAKRMELCGPDLDGRLGELRRGADRMRSLFGGRALPVLVPPWNRIDPALVEQLPGLGIAALSTFGLRKSAQAAPGLHQANTHVDPVDWRGGGGLAEEPALEKLAHAAEAAAAGRAEPIGLLTHHLVHDPWTWRFTEDLLARLAGRPGVAFIGVAAAVGLAGQ